MKEIQTYAAAKSSGILLNANENPLGISDEIRQEILDAVAEIDFARYPDSDQTELLEAYGSFMGIPSECLLAGNGSDQMLGFVIGTFLGKGKKLCTLSPDFSMYDYYASGYEAEVIKFKTEKDGSFRLENFISFAKENGADMILFSNPNNPSGKCLPIAEIEQIADSFQDIPVVIDEAYMDFSDETSALTLIDSFSSLYVTRTLAKAFGMAAIRTGFLVSNAENMKKLKAQFVPYALNSVSMKIASVVLRHGDEAGKQIETIKAERKRVYEALKDHPKIEIHNSEANFLYGFSKEKDAMLELLKEAGVTIRNYKGTDAFRITIGKKEENDIVLKALAEFGEGL